MLIHTPHSLRGPAPLHHAILSRDTHTGVSLQTLSDKTFDAGAILAQTPRPGIPIDPSWDVSSLTQRLATIGAEILIQGLREGVYIPPYTDVAGHYSATTAQRQRHAPKLEKFDYQIQWASWTASDAAIRSTKLREKVWTSAINKKGQPQRWTIESVEEVDPKDPSAWTDELKAFARHVQRQQRATQGDSTSPGYESETPETEEEHIFNINNLDTLIFRQTLQRPPKKSKSRSIFNSASISNPAEKMAENDATITSQQKQETPASTIDIHIPYFLDKKTPEGQGAIIIPLSKGGFLRITKITVEGKKEQSAAIVAEAHNQKHRQMASTGTTATAR